MTQAPEEGEDGQCGRGMDDPGRGGGVGDLDSGVR